MIGLVLVISFITVCAYFLNKKSVISPSFLYCLSFLFASIFALLNEKNWLLALNIKTFWVIVISILEFVVVCTIIQYVLRNLNINNSISINYIYTYSTEKGKTKFLLIELIQIIFIVTNIIVIKKITGQSNLSNAVNLLNYSTNGFISTNISIPTYAKLMLTFNQYVSILGEYLFIREWLINKKFSFYLLVEIFIGISSSMLTGSRGAAIMLMVTFVVFLFMTLPESYKNNNKKITKYIFGVLIGVIAVLYLLQWSATLVGRNVEAFKPFEYISIYVGAEIKNLDNFITLNKLPIAQDIWGKQTFYSIINFAIKHLGLGYESYNLSLPYQYVNGYNLGNVYTTLYPWLYDFGYQGVVWLTLIMAVVSEIIFIFSRKKDNTIVPISKLFYGGIIAPAIAFSFFSNKFYEAWDIISILLGILIWIFFNMLFKNDIQVRKN